MRRQRRSAPAPRARAALAGAACAGPRRTAAAGRGTGSSEGGVLRSTSKGSRRMVARIAAVGIGEVREPLDERVVRCLVGGGPCPRRQHADPHDRAQHRREREQQERDPDAAVNRSPKRRAAAACRSARAGSESCSATARTRGSSSAAAPGRRSTDWIRRPSESKQSCSASSMSLVVVGEAVRRAVAVARQPRRADVAADRREHGAHPRHLLVRARGAAPSGRRRRAAPATATTARSDADDAPPPRHAIPSGAAARILARAARGCERDRERARTSRSTPSRSRCSRPSRGTTGSA